MATLSKPIILLYLCKFGVIKKLSFPGLMFTHQLYAFGDPQSIRHSFAPSTIILL